MTRRLLLLSIVLAGCVGEDIDEDEGTVPADGFSDEVTGVVAPVGGFYRGRVLELYDLGALEPVVSAAGDFAGIRVHPMYRLTRGGAVDAAQLPIVDVIPPTAGYSPFFQIVLVEAESGLAANDIKSQATLLRRGLVRTPTSQLLHCPLLAPEAVVEPPAMSVDLALPVLELWFRKKHVRCLAIEGGDAFAAAGLPPPTADEVVVGDRTTYTIPAQDVYIPEVRIFDEEVEVPDNLVTDSIPGDAGYSPVMRVSEVVVRATYRAGGFDELTDIDPTLIEARVPETYLDLPIVGVAP